jgi:hypothetical protein
VDRHCYDVKIGIKIKNLDRHQNDAGPQHVLATKESEWTSLPHLQLKVQLRNVAFMSHVHAEISKESRKRKNRIARRSFYSLFGFGYFYVPGFQEILKGIEIKFECMDKKSVSMNKNLH